MSNESTMVATAEVRWFYQGTPPGAVSAWFEAFDPTAEPLRTDWYLQPTDAGMNIKWREGQIQPKRRDEPGEGVAFTEHIHGVLEYWRKWSFGLDEEAGNSLAGQSLWRPVEKKRLLTVFRRDERGHIVPADGETEAGCQVELATLEIEDDKWWSLCYEASGEKASLHDLLIDTAAYVFSQGTPPTLEQAHSCGYAAWLQAS